MVYLATGDYEKAIQNLETYHKMVGHPLKGLSGLAHAYAAGGYSEKAEECIKKLHQREIEEPNVILDMDYAFIYSGMREFDKAFEYLNRVYDRRTGIACLGMIFCIRYPMLDDLKSDPRFTQLMQRIGL
jgi:tetratricopeptide (TPR) repeat protein